MHAPQPCSGMQRTLDNRFANHHGLRMLRSWLVWILLGVTLLDSSAQQVLPNSMPATGTLSHAGHLYVALPALRDWFGLAFETPQAAAQTIRAAHDGREWTFLDGGNAIRLPDGTERALTRPLLVVGGTLYLHAGDARQFFDINVGPQTVKHRNKEIAAVPRSLASAFRTHEVTALTVENHPVRLVADITARPSLHRSTPSVQLKTGSTYLCRRRAIVDGVDYALLTDVGAVPASFLVRNDDLQTRSVESSLAETPWAKRLQWFKSEATQGRGLQAGPRESLAKSVCVTVDFCWSVRPLEAEFFRSLPTTTSQSLTLFPSGRWIEQHPVDMEALLKLEQDKGVEIIWGAHSWIHPKAGGFMNDLSPDELRADTLKLERELLAWGIVPTVYYRFPGLIHDATRLQSVIAMNLLPIDADAWVAVQASGKHPFGRPTRDGSIILLHGNGNEPQGISRFDSWRETHRDWQWRSLSEFLPSVSSP